MTETREDTPRTPEAFAQHLRDRLEAAAVEGRPMPEFVVRDVVVACGLQRRTPAGVAAIRAELEAANVYANVDLTDRSLDLDCTVRFGIGAFSGGRQQGRRFRSRAKRGAVTLVVGAGVSLPYGIPNWSTLAKRVWDTSFPGRPSPWTLRGEATLEALPQFLPIVFELARQHLDETDPEAFERALRRGLYGDRRYVNRLREVAESSDSLAVLARLLLRDYLRDGPHRITRVVTFNVDDLLERATQALYRAATDDTDRRSVPVAPVAGARSELWWANPSMPRDRDPIPIIHLHGYVPTQVGRGWDFGHRLVFTDSQYWRSGSGAMSYANRVMGAALSDGACVFIGTSMTDINLLRWLALHEADLRDDWSVFREQRRPSARDKPRRPYSSKLRHFWVRPEDDDPTGFLSAFLRERGIGSVSIADWVGPSFGRLIDEAFPDD